VTDFAQLARDALHEGGYTLRAAARATHYDPAYLSRVLNRKQPPSPQLAEALDRLLGTDGALLLAAQPSPDVTGVDAEIAFLRGTIAHFASHVERYGGAAIAPAAVQAWQGGRRRLEQGRVPERARPAYLSALAETAVMAGWLLYDSAHQAQSRRATQEAMTLARQAGDLPTELSALGILAIQDAALGRVDSALRITDDVLTGLRMPARVAALVRALRGWALALNGDQRRSFTDLAAARDGIHRSITPHDPHWTRKMGEKDILSMTGNALLAVGRPEAAADTLGRSLDLFSAACPDGWDVLFCRISLLSAHARAGSWQECEETLAKIPPLLSLIGSGLNRHRLSQICQELGRDRSAPSWLTELALDTANAVSPAKPVNAPSTTGGPP
jgi:helix-turn-helix protein